MADDDLPIFESSLGQKFLVVSNRDFINSIVPGDNFGDVIHRANDLVEIWKESVVICDFEGENMGWGGELLTAQFLPTSCLDLDSLSRIISRSDEATPERLGLFVDARSEEGWNLIAAIMQSKRMTKILYGADGDLASLRNQWCLSKCCACFSAVNPINVIDIQLAYSASRFKRVGLSRILERIPIDEVGSLPPKALEDGFYDAFGWNRRTWSFPMDKKTAKYAVDDIHRIEAVLKLIDPPTGDYTSAKAQTKNIENHPQNYIADWIDCEKKFYKRKYGIKKYQKGVQLARIALHIRLAYAGTSLSPRLAKTCTAVLALVENDLQHRGVFIPEDLDFEPEVGNELLAG